MADSAEGTENTETAAKAAEESSNDSGAAKLTQAEVDAIVERRLARERAKYEGFDEMKAKAARLDEIEAANASELEKANAAREKAEAKAAEAVSKSNERLIRATVLAEAAKQGAKNGEAVFRALDKTGLTVGDDGEVSGVEEAIKALFKEIPEFVGETKAEDADQGARGGSSDQITAEAVAAMSPEEVAKHLADGKLNHLL
jgi:hypothetical protein